jgi:FixJ family two-component response regulator
MTNQQKTVCILDDDPDMRKALERVLSVHGYRPSSFASIAEFHADARPQEALCLILDVHLKGESGFDLKQQLSHAAPALPVIFITGRDSETSRETAQQVGGAAYLVKPFESKALLDALETAIHTVIIDAEGRQTENESDRFSPAKVM